MATNAQDVLPPGFALDDPANAHALPAGFKVDDPASSPAADPHALPPGFKVSGWLDPDGVIGRHLNAANEGLISVLGAPADLSAAAERALGFNVPADSGATSPSIHRLFEKFGWVAPSGDPNFAPRSGVERYTQSVANAGGQAALPLAGTLGAGARLAAGGEAALNNGTVSSALKSILADAARNPGVTIASDAGAAVGQGVGGQAARDEFPGNRWADLGGQLLGGFTGGLGAGLAVKRRAADAVAIGTDKAASNARQDAEQVAVGATLPGNPWTTAELAQGWRKGADGTTEWAPDANAGKPEPVGGWSIDPETGKPRLTVDIVGGIREPAAPSAKPIVIDSTTLRGLASDADGAVDMRAAGDHLRSASDEALARGGKVTLHVGDGRTVDITGPGMTDADGQRWGAMPILSPKPGENPRLEITPPGHVEDMATDIPPDASISAPVINEAAPHDLPEGYTLDQPIAPKATRRMDERPSAEQIAEVANRTEPGDVVPIPNNAVESADEAARIAEGRYPAVQAPNERDVLPSYTLPGQTRPRRNPMDLVSWLRNQGGVRERGGELRSMGINNKPRSIDFAKDEGFLGNLVTERGMKFDEAARAAWEAGYFPDHIDRPTPSEFLDALRETHRGGPGRVFHPDDYATIDDYHKAVADRHMIEEAAARGEPLHDDRGQPISLSDLEANSAPATAYEDLPSVGGKVGNIAVDKLGTVGDIRRALQTVDNRFGGFDAARRGKITQAETEALASELNMTAKDLLSRRKGQAFNAEEALAARAILAKSGDELVKLARAAQGGSDEAVAAFREGLVRHAAIQEQIAGATAEAGRALAQFRMTASGKLARGRILASAIEAGGGRDKIEEAAQAVLDLANRAHNSGNPAELNDFARNAAKPKAADILTELWINSLLSGPRTHVTNMVGNAMTQLWMLPEHALTAGIGSITQSADKMLMRDVGARAVGLIQGAREGMTLAREAFLTGMPSDGAAKFESQQYRAIPGKLGEVVRVPTRLLTAEDEFFKAVAYRQEINALAARQAYRGDRTAAERSARYEELRNNPTDEMVDAAHKAAQYATFQQPLKELGRAAQTISNARLAGLPLGKVIIPFVRTPLNLLKFAVERSPMAPVMEEVRDALKAGGMRRDQALARVAMGSGLGALAVTWAMDGKLSGSGPADRRELSALRNTGWQPYSIKIGDKWYSYERMDPFARILSTAADFATFGDYMTPEERDNTAKNLSIAIARNISSMPTLDPASNAFSALSDPDRFLVRYGKNLAASAAVPAFVTQLNASSDPYLRETATLLDTIKSRVPTLSDQLPAQMNMWGQPITRSAAFGGATVSPIWTSAEKHDKALDEVARLQVALSKPDRKVGDQQMTAKQYARFVYMAGAPAKQVLDRMVAEPAWDELPDGAKRIMIKKTVEEFRKQARYQILASYPDLLRAAMDEKFKRKTGER